MQTTRPLRYLVPALVAGLLLVGCGSSGIGDIFGSDDDRTTEQVSLVRGTVERVDTYDRTLVVDGESDMRYGLRNGGDERYVLHYDDQTRVEYQGQYYQPADLEVGDRISARVDDRGGRLDVMDIEVVYDVSGGGSYDPYDDDRYDDDRYDGRSADLRDMRVRWIDTRDRMIELERTTAYNRFSTGGNADDVVRLYYDDRTVVEYQGRRSYSPENLERGDVIDVETRDLGGRLLAEEITVLSDVRASR